MSTTLLRCANGHEWTARTEVLAGSTLPCCPICGSVERTLLTPPTFPESRPGVPPFSSSGDGLDGLPQQVPALPGYEILRELGRGGMGVVYLAREVARDRLVALKVIRKERLANPELINRFRREAQAAERLSHPNVVALHDAGSTTLPLIGELHYLSMEYVPGITLQALVEQAGPLLVAVVCDVIRQAALGLQHASEQGLVHRDIKPSNIMVVAPNGLPLPPRPLVKILDLGVARLSSRQLEESLTTLTRDGAVIGTADYIAPEQVENPRGADIRADLYSLGCTFYFLLTGSVPFPGGSLVQKLDRQRWHTPASVDQIRREIPAPVARVVRQLMAKHPDDRFRSPGELAAVLDELVRTGELPGAHQPVPIKERACLSGHTGHVTALAFGPGGEWLASGGTDGTVRLWDLAPVKERTRPSDGKHEVACLAVAGGSGLVLAGQGVTVHAWDSASGREVFTLRGHSDAVRSLSLSSDGKLLASGGDDRTIRIWDVQTGRPIQRLSGHRAAVAGVALSPDGRLVVSAGRDQTLRVWERSSGRELRTFSVPRGPVLCVVFAPDGQTVLSGHFDTTLRLWDVDTGRELRRLAGHRQMVTALAFTPQGLAVSGSHDQTVRIWDPASGSEVHSCPGHAGPVACVAVHPGGKVLASGSFDRTVRVWELPA